MAMLPINGEKMHKAIKATGHTLVSASQAIDRAPSFLSNAKNRCRIDSLAADVLEDRLNVSKDLYTVQETFTPEEPEQLAFTTDAATLGEILEELKALRRELVHVVDYLDDQAKKAAGWMDDPDF